MLQIIDFVNRFQFENSWANDICKLIILLSFFCIIGIFVKILIKWRI